MEIKYSETHIKYWKQKLKTMKMIISGFYRILTEAVAMEGTDVIVFKMKVKVHMATSGQRTYKWTTLHKGMIR